MAQNKNRIKAPEFPEGMSWLNSGRPLSLADLRGKVVLLDFWTYCCINCMHVLPKLEKLEQKYGDALVVIGVHSAKFVNEGESENIRQAILRYEISHPVVNDRDFVIWNSYGVHAWPSMTLIDAEGYMVAAQSGEGAPEAFDPLIEESIKEYEAKGKLDRTPLNLKLERDSAPPSVLSFPGKVHLDAKGKRLFISDSNHNRILMVSLPQGEVLEVIGSGGGGWKDGSFEEVQFDHPQGLTLDDEILYIADTENHLLRAADLKKRIVSTIAGTGKQASFYSPIGKPLETALNSPWDLVFFKDNLFIAMAGPHQIWLMDLKKDRIGVYAGSGREDRIDGALKQAALAQPSGITRDDERLYFADSEVSSIRWADLNPKGSVGTIVGEALFEFGDVDGYGAKVRLQHPLGVTYHDGFLYVADTYNNKIKKIDPDKRTSYTFAGTGEEGFNDGKLEDATFDEPGGIAAALDGKLYVADTNNHLIRVIDPAAGMVSTLRLQGLEKLASQARKAPQIEAMKTWQIPASGGEVVIQAEFPPGLKQSPGSPILVSVSYNGKSMKEVKEFKALSFPLKIPLTETGKYSEIAVSLFFNYCSEANEGLCYYGEKSFRIPFEVKDLGDEVYNVRIEVAKPMI